jgi:hypothetical protein
MTFLYSVIIADSLQRLIADSLYRRVGFPVEKQLLGLGPEKQSVYALVLCKVTCFLTASCPGKIQLIE